MTKTAPFSMRLPPDLKDELSQLAENDRRSLTNYIEGILIEHTRRERVRQRLIEESNRARREEQASA